MKAVIRMECTILAGFVRFANVRLRRDGASLLLGFGGDGRFGQLLLPRLDEVERLLRVEGVEIGSADCVEEWVFFEAEERELPVGGAR